MIERRQKYIRNLYECMPKRWKREELMEYFMSDKNITRVEYITYIRWTLDVSADELAKSIGTTRQTINNVEFGKYKTNVSMTYLAIRNQLLKMIIECNDERVQGICMWLFEQMIRA